MALVAPERPHVKTERVLGSFEGFSIYLSMLAFVCLRAGTATMSMNLTRLSLRQVRRGRAFTISDTSRFHCKIMQIFTSQCNSHRLVCLAMNVCHLCLCDDGNVSKVNQLAAQSPESCPPKARSGQLQMRLHGNGPCDGTSPGTPWHLQR